jgi:hypothetical protein
MAKGALAVVLAGSFTFSASQAFADGTANQQDHNQTVNLQSGSSAEISTAPTSESKETPSLLPGDFFYFAKIALEKIQLALTFDDVKQAKLLAGFASERLAEAQALFASGDQDRALKTINEALEDMKNAETSVDTQKTAASSTKQEDVNNQTTNSNQIKADDEKSVKDNDQSNSEINKDDQESLAVKQTINQNIAALTVALNKVKNPVAKAALQRNIEKRYAKLAEKMAKFNKDSANENDQADQADEVKNENPATSTDASITVNSETPASSANTSVTENGENTNDAAAVKADISSETNITKPANDEQTGTRVNQDVKHEQQAIKQEVKQQVIQKKEEVKTFVQEKKNEMKQKVDEIRGNTH